MAEDTVGQNVANANTAGYDEESCPTRRLAVDANHWAFTPAATVPAMGLRWKASSASPIPTCSRKAIPSRATRACSARSKAASKRSSRTSRSPPATASPAS